ncbi:MAG: fumarylacetoacetate hydrolase family protein [Cyclobacteriaceae bacterium]
MKVYHTRSGIVVAFWGNYYATSADWDTFVNRTELHESILSELGTYRRDSNCKAWIEHELLPPIGTQEVWAAGVTYSRSKEARMDESKATGGATFYDKVYEAERPELFFKSSASRVVGHGGTVRIRRDSTWNVPEPELTLFISASGSIEGYTIGNDVSSRSIEGDNPLYLPQAKTYQYSAALGPCLYVPENPISPDTHITMEIVRSGESLYHDKVAISKMKRTHTELAEFLFRETEFPAGCLLMTGTCLVPADHFTLKPADLVHITIDNIGTLSNLVGVREI